MTVTTFPRHHDDDVWAEHDEPIPYALTMTGKLTAYVAALDVLTPAELLAYANRDVTAVSA